MTFGWDVRNTAVKLHDLGYTSEDKARIMEDYGMTSEEAQDVIDWMRDWIETGADSCADMPITDVSISHPVREGDRGTDYRPSRVPEWE